MRQQGKKGAALALIFTGLTACQKGLIGERLTGRTSGGAVDTTGDPTNTGGPAGTGTGAGTGGSPGTGGSGTGGSGGAGGGTSEAMMLPARIRRLTTAEYDTSVNALLGATSTFGKTFTPDARQDGFTRNDAQRVDPVFIMQADDAATQLATQARAKFNTLAPCSNAATGGEACARTFAQTFAARAYRRPVTTTEVDTLLAVYRVGAEGAAYADGIETLIHAVLMSPGFLYVTELGDPAALAGPASITLTPHEVASAMSYLLTGGPPDDTLLATATSGEIMTTATRQTQARRLFDSPAAQAQVVRIIEEWLGIDRITDTGKDSNAYPDFAGLKDAMKREADAFVSEVMWKTTRDVKDLLSADWTIADAALAKMYGGTTANGRVSLTNVPRRGVLNQGAFLSVYAHASESGPVLRGVSMLRRIACVDMPSPTSLNINVTPPVPDPSKTTRDRFAAHVADATCASCHKKIDSFGFAFENFDGMGKVRTTENNQKIDSTTTIGLTLDFDGSYADSSALVAKMATSPVVRACFARHLFRAAAANSEAPNLPAENAFVSTWGALPDGAQGNLSEILVAWLGSDTFIQRRAAP